MGRVVTIVTDHKALSFLQSCRLLNARLTRWVLYLQEYDLRVVHCKGSENIVADALSRAPLGNFVELPEDSEVHVTKLSEHSKIIRKNMENLLKAQLNDEYCSYVKGELLKSGGLKRYKSWFVLHKDVLFKRGSQSCPGFKIIVPRAHIISLVLQEHIDNGHFGIRKCATYLKRYYFFPKFEKRIRQIINSCMLCQQAKVAPRAAGMMHSVLREEINELVCTDLMGPLPVSRGGVEYVLVFVDVFSKHVVCRALKKATARAILRVLTSVYIPLAGKPKAILSDNGSQFMSKIWLEGLAELVIKVIHTSVYFPQGNQVERVNREIGRILRTFCHAQHTKWALYLGEVEQWLNNAIHESTGFSPNEIHFSKPRENSFISKINFPEVGGCFSLPDNIKLIVKQNLLTKAEKRQLRHDRSVKSQIFKPGDRVLIRNHERSSAESRVIKKLFLLYVGPYRVRAKAGPNSYEIEDEETGAFVGVHNVYNLKPFRNKTDALFELK